MRIYCQHYASAGSPLAVLVRCCAGCKFQPGSLFSTVLRHFCFFSSRYISNNRFIEIKTCSRPCTKGQIFIVPKSTIVELFSKFRRFCINSGFFAKMTGLLYLFSLNAHIVARQRHKVLQDSLVSLESP